MIKEQHLSKELSTGNICLDIYPVGEDVSAVLYGGEKPHIGCTVIAVPRKSLTGDGSISCTSSVINVSGHKDEDICRVAAESLCRRYNTTVTCSGGFHKDNITAEEIKELQTAVSEILSAPE